MPKRDFYYTFARSTRYLPETILSQDFSTFPLHSQLIDAVKAQGYTTASPIQESAIPAVLSGKDILAAAQTGTGKTAAFVLPILEKFIQQPPLLKANHIESLILAPTRELAAQIASSINDYKGSSQIISHVVFGGVSINPQMKNLRKGCHILVATPGRLLDLHQRNAIKFANVKMLVLDEADRMLDMGFIHDIKRVLKLLPKQRQNLLFSATFTDSIRALASSVVNNPIEISVSPSNSASNNIEHSIIYVEKSKKSSLLSHLITSNNWQQMLVFTRTKHGANRLCKQLVNKGMPAAAIHGNKSQGARTKALAEFKQGDIQVLVATDIAARGIDISQLPYVVNYDLPNVAQDYVHRIGRTGRAGKTGQAVSFVTIEELKQLADIQNLLRQHIKETKVKGLSMPQDIKPMPLKTLKPNKPKKRKQPQTKAN